MKSLVSPSIVIPPLSPFQNCKLGRKKYATALTSIITSYKDGFVLAINNEWGAGKTTFVKMWQKELELAKVKTIYFNAWENDLEEDVLVALIGALMELQEEKTPIKDKLIKSAKPFLNTAVSIITKIALSKAGLKDEDLLELFGNIAKGANDYWEIRIEESKKRKKSIEEFKSNLQKYISPELNNKPLVFIIDELDRCRPNYAVEVLEKIKHLFSIPGIVFVLAIDKTQLCASINGVYGSEKLDSNEYLKRFIDLEYSIPTPNTKTYINYLENYYNIINDYQKSSFKNPYHDFMEDAKDTILILEKTNKFSLREIEKYFILLKLMLNQSSQNNQYFKASYLFLLVFIKFNNKDLFSKITNKSISTYDLTIELFNNFKQILKQNSEFNSNVDFYELISFIIFCYFQFDLDGRKIRDNIREELQRFPEVEFDKIEPYLKNMEQYYRGYSPMFHYIRVISLTENLNID